MNTIIRTIHSHVNKLKNKNGSKVSEHDIYAHKVATPLELFFDLVFVVVVAAIAANLHHQLAHGHYIQGIIMFIIHVGFMFRAWVDYSWVSSAFDDNSLVFRLCSLGQMFGVIIFASGLILSSDNYNHNLYIMTLGYIFIRVSMIIQLWYSSKVHKKYKKVCKKYILCLILIQIAWVVRATMDFFLSLNIYIAISIDFILLFIDFMIIVFVTRKDPMPYNSNHIVERYGLLTIIILGESVLATTNTVANLVQQGNNNAIYAIGFLLISLVFALWWSYFQLGFARTLQKHQEKNKRSASFIFGYGHFFIFAPLIALASVLEIVADTYSIKYKAIEAYSNINIIIFLLAFTVAIFTVTLIFMKHHFSNTSKRFFFISLLIAFANPFIAVNITYVNNSITYGLVTLLVGQILQILVFSRENKKFGVLHLESENH